MGHTIHDQTQLICNIQFFSIALGVTNIVGVPVGGFGVPFTSLPDSKAQTYLKVNIHPKSCPAHVLNQSTDCVHYAILVHSCRQPSQAFRSMSLWKTLLNGSISRDYKNIPNPYLGVACFFHLCYFFPSMASSL